MTEQLETSTLAFANTLLKTAFRQNIEVTVRKLQCLLYLAHAGYLQSTGLGLFAENFQHLRSGPGLPSIQAIFDCYGTQPIRTLAENAKHDSPILNFTRNPHLQPIVSHIETAFLPMTESELMEIVNRKKVKPDA